MQFIGIDVHKRIYTASVLDDQNKTVFEIIDAETAESGFQPLFDQCPPAQSLVLIENSTRSHLVEAIFRCRGYGILVAHTGSGCMPEIARAKLKTDIVDARKLAQLAKDFHDGRRPDLRLAHLSGDANMQDKALCRVCSECTVIRTQMNVRIQEYLSLHGIVLPDGYRSVEAARSIRWLRQRDEPALNVMLCMLEAAEQQIAYAESQLERRFADDPDVKLLQTIRGIGVRTAAVIVTAIDGIGRFSAPDQLVSYFGLDPVVAESAGQRKPRGVSKDGDPLVRACLANTVVKHAMMCPTSELSRYYRRQKQRMPHWKAVTAAIRKLTCIIWAMLTRHEPFVFNPDGGAVGSRSPTGAVPTP